MFAFLIACSLVCLFSCSPASLFACLFYFFACLLGNKIYLPEIIDHGDHLLLVFVFVVVSERFYESLNYVVDAPHSFFLKVLCL